MKKILILKTGNTIPTIANNQEDFEHWIIRDMNMDKRQFEILDTPIGQLPGDLSGYRGIVVTGSPAMVTEKLEWSEALAEFLADAVLKKIPVLGICYGHQLLGYALGGKVGFHPRGREIGTVDIELNKVVADDVLFQQLPRRFKANVTHSQTLLTLPANARVIASNDFEPHHAVRFSDNAWGVQFHPEFNGRVMSAYIDYRKSDLEQEGFEVDELQSRVKDTPESSSVLAHFSALL